jgi:hypothetical protein
MGPLRTSPGRREAGTRNPGAPASRSPSDGSRWQSPSGRGSGKRGRLGEDRGLPPSRLGLTGGGSRDAWRVSRQREACRTSWSTSASKAHDRPPREPPKGPSKKGKAGDQLRKDRGSPAFPLWSVWSTTRRQLTPPRELLAFRTLLERGRGRGCRCGRASDRSPLRRCGQWPWPCRLGRLIFSFDPFDRLAG